MKRIKYCIANWKMYQNIENVDSFIYKLKDFFGNLDDSPYGNSNFVSTYTTLKKLDDDEAEDSDGTDDFVFQPGVGFIPRRRFLRRVQTLKEGDLPTARKGGLMGQ